MTVEYLVLFDRAEDFRDSDAIFHRLLPVHSSLKVTDTTLEHDDVIAAGPLLGWDREIAVLKNPSWTSVNRAWCRCRVPQSCRIHRHQLRFPSR